MKQTVMQTILLVFLFLSLIEAQAKKVEVITVDNANEFIAAIGSDRTIQLKGSTIYLSEVSSYNAGKHYGFADAFDGKELVISNVKNLTIKGLGNKPVKIITKPVYGNVISFENCAGITIENVDAGHGPKKGGCTGGVLKFDKSKNITINRSIMYGSGTEGITANTVSNLQCNKSIIRGCTYSIMTLNNCTEIEFNDCEFTDNQEFDLVNIFNCINIVFKSCIFDSNHTGTQSYADYALFCINQSASVVLKDCTIENNLACYFSKNANTIEMKNTKLENNSFTKGNFKN